MLLNTTLPATSFYYIRHGESEGNVQKLCQGQLDFPLTSDGREQALLAGNALINCNIHTIYYSPLSRATETAKIIFDITNAQKMVPVAELMERSWGELEGKSNELMFAHEERERMSDYLESADPIIFEKKSAFLARIETAMNIALQKTDNPIAIVGHGRFFNMMCDLMNTAPIKQIGNGVPLLCQPVNGNWSVTAVS